LTDKWNGFADLLANLIEKYAAVLDIDNLVWRKKTHLKNPVTLLN